MTAIAPLTTLAAWQALDAHYPKVRELHLRKLFADDPKRGERMTSEAVGIYFDYSKHCITDRIIPELETGVERQLKHDSSTYTLIRRYGRSKELLHGR